MVQFDEWKNMRLRGSHSIGFLMGEYSDNDERVLCPNVNNPRNWETCENAKECIGDRARLVSLLEGVNRTSPCSLFYACMLLFLSSFHHYALFACIEFLSFSSLSLSVAVYSFLFPYPCVYVHSAVVGDGGAVI